jgi:hypothetical protein
MPEVAEMSCFDHRLLLQDEHAAHESVRRMRESQPENRAEIARLEKLAGDVSFKLREHLAICPECKKAT